MPGRRQQKLLVKIARDYLRRHMPDLKDMPLRMHALDGPPKSPRYSVTAEACSANRCPYGIPTDVAAAGQCTVLDCPLRQSARLLIDRRWRVVQASRSGIHWG